MRSRRFFAVVALAVLAATPVLHHHTLTASSDGDQASSLQTVCAVCIHGKTVAPPEGVSLPPLEITEILPETPQPALESFETSLSPARAPPHAA